MDYSRNALGYIEVGFECGNGIIDTDINYTIKCKIKIKQLSRKTTVVQTARSL